jgi:hypothetical protein
MWCGYGYPSLLGEKSWVLQARLWTMDNGKWTMDNKDFNGMNLSSPYSLGNWNPGDRRDVKEDIY